MTIKNSETIKNRLASNSHESVTSKIKKFYSFLSPTGCSLNFRARVSNIDEALLQARNSELESKKYLSYELSRLNFKPRKPFRLSKREKLPSLIYTPSPKKQTSFCESPKSQNSKKLTPIIPKLKKPELFSLPTRFKSLPMHQDPQYIFPSERNSPTSFLSKSIPKIESVHSIISTCRKMTGHKSQKMVKFLNKESKKQSLNFLDFVEDLDESLKTGRTKEESERIMAIKRFNRTIDERLEEESKATIEDDINGFAKITREKGKILIYRHKHPTLIKELNETINSLEARVYLNY